MRSAIFLGLFGDGTPPQERWRTKHQSTGGSAVKEERRILIVDDDRESTHLTQKDGGDVAAQIEADPGIQRTPIIFLTALVTKAEAKAGVQIEGHPVVAKPVNIPELTKRIEENIPPL